MNNWLNKKYLNKAISVFFAVVIIVVSSFPAIANSVGSTSFDSTSCNVMNIINGTAGRIFASLVIISVGIGFVNGKVSWGLMIGVVIGIATMFGAPSVVAALSGGDATECESGAMYVTTCRGSECFSCPLGFSGPACNVCATGFVGVDCDQCDAGYLGFACDDCDTANGYSPFRGECHLGCAVDINGVSTLSVLAGSSSLRCDKPGFFGVIPYVCQNKTLSFGAKTSCDCRGNRTGTNCNQCLDGYDLATNCSTCLAGYLMVNGRCQKDCEVYGINGISDGTLAIAETGILPCNKGYDGFVSYSCIDGNFSDHGNCTCSIGHLGPITNCAQSCDVANGYQSVGGECRKGCTISVAGITETFVDEALTTTPLNCTAPNYTGSVNYTCSANSFSKVGDCSCEMGKSLSSNCTSCDTANDYSDYDNDGVCELQCTINGEVGIIDGTKVDSKSTTFDCNQSTSGGTITYVCNNGNLQNIVNNCGPTSCKGGSEIKAAGKLIHIFTTTNTLECQSVKNVEILLVAGGGGGGGNGGGGGGGGGVVYRSSFNIPVGIHDVIVGKGGRGTGNEDPSLGNGENSSISVSGISEAIGGGGGASRDTGGGASSGGSGGGGGGGHGTQSKAGTGTSGQGNSGGSGNESHCSSAGGGGGGAGSSGKSALTTIGGNGGDGYVSSISGASVVYSSGGGGGRTCDNGGNTGTGGFGAGNGTVNGNGENATGYGSGGGGGRGAGGSGKSGIVIISYDDL